MKMGRNEKHRAVELYRTGLSVAQVATRIGVNAKSIEKAIEDYGDVIRDEDKEKKSAYTKAFQEEFTQRWKEIRMAAGKE